MMCLERCVALVVCGERLETSGDNEKAEGKEKGGDGR